VSGVEADDLKQSIDTFDEHVSYVPSAEVIEMQQKMSALYQQQLKKGGIIDLEAERNKYLIPKVIVVTTSHVYYSGSFDWATGLASTSSDIPKSLLLENVIVVAQWVA